MFDFNHISSLDQVRWNVTCLPLTRTCLWSTICLASRLVPEWLDVDAEALKGTVKELPKREVIDVPVDEMLIVELYSK